MACCISGYSLLGNFSSISSQAFFAIIRGKEQSFAFVLLRYNSHVLCSRLHQMSEFLIFLHFSTLHTHHVTLNGCWIHIYTHTHTLHPMHQCFNEYIDVDAVLVFFLKTTFPNFSLLSFLSGIETVHHVLYV